VNEPIFLKALIFQTKMKNTQKVRLDFNSLRSQSTLQRQLRRQILKNTRYVFYFIKKEKQEVLTRLPNREIEYSFFF
jgi:hypothetical protein